jgi:formylmethanofuran dehydrogenase subunit D
VLEYEDPSRQMGEKPKLQVTLITGRTIDQGVGKEQGKASDEYRDSVSICHVDPEDLKKLGVKEKSNVLVSTVYGSVVVKAIKSPRAPHAGMIFIPYGPWANAVVNPETHSIGMPSLKGIPVEIEPAQDKPLLNLSELLKEQFRK